MKEDNMALNPGETLNNRYQIAETIHEGTMAVNYKAKDTLQREHGFHQGIPDVSL